MNHDVRYYAESYIAFDRIYRSVAALLAQLTIWMETGGQTGGNESGEKSKTL